MPVKRYLQVPTLSGVVAGQKATANLPLGQSYKSLQIRAASTAGLSIDNIISECRIKLNGKTQRTFSMTDLDSMNKLNNPQGSTEYSKKAGGTAAIGSAGYAELIPIFFAEPWRKQYAASDGLGWSTGGVNTFQLEFDVIAGVAGPAINVMAEIDDSVVSDDKGNNAPAPIGNIVKWYKNFIPVTGLITPFNGFNRGNYFQQISIIDGTGTISDVTLKVNGFEIRDKITKEQNDALLINKGLTPVAGRYDIVLDADDQIDSALPSIINGKPASTFELKITNTDATARNLTLITHEFGFPD